MKSRLSVKQLVGALEASRCREPPSTGLYPQTSGGGDLAGIDTCK